MKSRILSWLSIYSFALVIPVAVLLLISIGIDLSGAFPRSAKAETGVSLQPAAGSACSPTLLKGTYSFLTTGFGPVPPQDLLQTPVGVIGNWGSLLPLHAIGHVKFAADGTNVGYIHENVGGALEGSVPFEGKVTDFQKGPHGEGCWAIWELQDRHHLPIFANEPPHFFRIAIGKGRFEFVTFGGGPGPAVLSGFATRTD